MKANRLIITAVIASLHHHPHICIVFHFLAAALFNVWHLLPFPVDFTFLPSKQSILTQSSIPFIICLFHPTLPLCGSISDSSIIPLFLPAFLHQKVMEFEPCKGGDWHSIKTKSWPRCCSFGSKSVPAPFLCANRVSGRGALYCIRYLCLCRSVQTDTVAATRKMQSGRRTHDAMQSHNKQTGFLTSHQRCIVA